MIGESGLRAGPVTAEEMAWLMHRSRSFDLPTLRNMCAAPGGIWEPSKLASCTTQGARELINSAEASVRSMAGELIARTNA